MMHRLHEEDFTGFVQQSGDWEELSPSALGVEEEAFTSQMVFGPRIRRSVASTYST